MREGLVDRVAALEQVADGEPHPLDRTHRQQLHHAERFADLTPAMGKEAQRPRRGDGRILLAQRSRGGIARVRENLAAGGFLAFVERGEVGLRHVDFAAHLDHLGRVGDALRNVGYGADVGGDVLAHAAVPARRRQHQRALLIAQRA